MRFGTPERQSLKQEAKLLIIRNIRYCVTASAVLVIISMLVSIIKTLMLSNIPDFVGIASIDDVAAFYERFSADPLLIGTQLWNFYLTNFLYEQLGNVIGVILEAPLLLAAMAGFYHMVVNGQSPSRRTLTGWYTRIGLSARSIGLLFLLDVLFEILMVVLVYAPIVLMMYITVTAMAAGAAFVPVWVALLPLVSLGGLVLGAFLYSRWLPALHFMAKYPHLGPIGAIRKSNAELKGHKRQYIVLILSFVPWLLLEAVTYGFAGIYVIPYMELTVTLFLERIRQENDPPPEPIPE